MTTSKHKNTSLVTKTAHQHILPRPWIPTSWNRSVTTGTGSLETTRFNKGDQYDDILSVALNQSNVSIAQSLLDNTIALLRKGNPELAWECYRDLTCRHIQKYISRDQYRQLIKLFNHSKTHHTQCLEYMLTLVEDMKQLGYQVGRREKLLLMRSLGLNGNIKAMEKIFEDLKNEELLVLPSQIDGNVQKPFNIMLTTYGEQAESIGPMAVAEKSMYIYGEMLNRNIRPTPSTTLALIDNIKLAGRSDRMVEKVWEWIWIKIGMNVAGKSKDLDPTLYRDMVLYFSSAGRPEYALEINDIMTKRKIPRTVRMMTSLIHKVGRAGDIDRSMELLNEMMVAKLEPTLVTFNALIDIHAHKKPEPDVAGAKLIYNMLGEVGLLPDNVTFGTLIDMYAKKGDLNGARKLLGDMKALKITPSPYIFSSFIECFIVLNDHDSAMDILKLLKKQANRGLPPAREAYNLMCKGLVEGGYIREAIMLLEVMNKEKMGLESRTFNPLMSYYAKRGDSEGAHRVAFMMTQAAVKPSSHSYTILLNSYAKAGDIEGAENIFQILKQKYRPTSHAYNALLYVYTKNNVMDKVLDTYKRMSKASVHPNEYTYSILMYFYSRRKEVRSVESLIETMQSNNITPGAICWTILMQTYFECGKSDDGKNVMDRMIRAGWEPSAISWSVMINGLIKADKLYLAESALTEVIDRSQQRTVTNYNKRRLLKDTVDFPDYDKTLPETIEDVLNKASLDKLKSKTMLSAYLFSPIIDAHSKAGNFEQAKKFYKSMCKLSVPTTLPVFITLMNIFDTEANHDAVESMWNALYKNDTSKLKNLDPILEEPIPVPNIEYNYTNLLTLDDQDSTEISKPLTPKHVSPFALSVYMNTLITQKRHDVMEALWTDLSRKGYLFDEHNWNRYIVALVEAGKLDKACQVISREFFHKSKDDGVSNIRKTHRKRDDIFISNNDQLHTRTCALLADALQITGAENMGEPRLRTTVSNTVKEYVNYLDKMDKLEKTNV